MDDLNDNDDMRELFEYFINKKINPTSALKIMAKTTYFLICALSDDGIQDLINDEEYEDESN